MDRIRAAGAEDRLDGADGYDRIAGKQGERVGSRRADDGFEQARRERTAREHVDRVAGTGRAEHAVHGAHAHRVAGIDELHDLGGRRGAEHRADGGDGNGEGAGADQSQDVVVAGDADDALDGGQGDGGIGHQSDRVGRAGGADDRFHAGDHDVGLAHEHHGVRGYGAEHGFDVGDRDGAATEGAQHVGGAGRTDDLLDQRGGDGFVRADDAHGVAAGGRADDGLDRADVDGLRTEQTHGVRSVGRADDAVHARDREGCSRARR